MSENICPHAPHEFDINDVWSKTAQGYWFHCKECHRILLADEPMMEAAQPTGRISFAWKNKGADRMSENNGIAGHFIMGDGLNHYASDVPWIPPSNAPQMPMSVAELRAFVRAEVHKALDDLADELRQGKAFQPVDTREFRRVEQTEDSGKRFRGVLYRVDETPVDEAATDPELPSVDVRVPSGVCWACGGHGESAEMMWYGAHLIHATTECARGAEVKPETREHRG